MGLHPTGHHIYAQVGYLLPIPTKVVQVQPYVGAQISLFDALDDVAPIMDAGINMFFLGHHSKITIHYRNRPIFENKDGRKAYTQSASEVILQLMLFI